MFNPKRIAQLAAVLALLTTLSSPVNSQPAATTWVLEKGQNIPPRPPRTPLLRMEGDKLSGSTGCNLFTAKVSEKGDKRVAIEQVALTRKLCAPKLNKIEVEVVRAFEQTQFIEMEGKRLSFLSASRQPLLIWTRNGKRAAKEPERPKKRAGVRTRQATHARVHGRGRPRHARRSRDHRRARHSSANRGCYSWEMRIWHWRWF